MKAIKKISASLLFLILLAGAVPGYGAERADFDAVGDFLRSINALKGVVPTVPDGDPASESLRSKFQIPGRVPIVSPHGGREILVYVYNAENAIPGDGDSGISISSSQFKYLLSPFNLKVAYALFSEEPLKIDNVTYAFKPAADGNVSVYYVMGSGRVSTATLADGQSLYVPGSGIIVKGVPVK